MAAKNIDKWMYKLNFKIWLSKSRFKENQNPEKALAKLKAEDSDPSTAPKFELVDGIGSSDNKHFEIRGNKIYSKNAFDYEDKNAYAVRVRSTDADGTVHEQNLGFVVKNEQEIDDITGIRTRASYDSTSVNFINNTQGAFWVNSADNRFGQFVLNPGQEHRVTGSISGNDNYDVNANINIFRLEQGQKHTYVGNMRFNNKVGTGMGIPIASSDDKSFFSPSYNGNPLPDGYFYYDRPVYGKATPAKSWQPIKNGYLDKIHILGEGSVRSKENGLLMDNVVFQSYYFGSIEGQKRWDFVATELPPL